MIKTILKLLWPEVCPFCQKPWKKGTCPACSRKIQQLVIKEPRCMRCGKPVGKEEQEYCHDCSRSEHFYKRGLSIWLHRALISNSIYQFKYHNQRVNGTYYAQELVNQFGKQINLWKPELIIPIPLHKKRKRKRGFNQAEIIAVKLGEILHVPVDSKSVKRVRDTLPQKQIMHAGRKGNIANAFSVSPTLPTARSVLLIDDIYTTGNTIDEVSKQLEKAGVGNIYFLTISIGQGY